MITHEGPDGLILEIDTNDAATPVMVRSPCGTYCATYDCAIAMGELEDAYELSRGQLSWLDGFEARVEKAVNIARPVDGKWHTEQRHVR